MVLGHGLNGDDFVHHPHELQERLGDELFGYISAELSSLPPLNLSLGKTPSFINLLKTKLSNNTEGLDLTSSKSVSEKLKASNLPAAFIRIGSWQHVSKNEADLVAKCYFSKKKLVWEVLMNGLKSKIEVRWSGISAIRASLGENQTGILEIELDQAPAFYRESNPQPKKHTIWHLTTDFTGGQVSMHKRHYVRFPPGTLDKHYAKLLECDTRLLELSKKGFPAHNSPHFDWIPYEDNNSFYYSFSNNNTDDTSPADMKMKINPQHIQTPQWTFQPPLLMEEYSTTSPMSGSWDDTNSSDFPQNDQGPGYGFGDPAMDIWGNNGNYPSLYGEASSLGAEMLKNSQQHLINDSSDDLEYFCDMGFDILERESTLDSLMDMSSEVMDSTLPFQVNYNDTVTSCTEQLFESITKEQTNCNQLSLPSSRVCDENWDRQFRLEKGFLYPSYVEEFVEEDSLRMNWY